MTTLTLTNDEGDLLINYKNLLPCGSIVNYSGDNAPNGWLICDGSEISRTTYASLFSIIGTKYGSSSTIHNFKLPDLGQRIPVGYKSGINSLGNTGGNNSITLTTNQIPSHTHTGTSDSNGAHTHTGTSDSSGTHNHTASDSGHTHTYVDAYFAENQAGVQINNHGTAASTDTDNEYYYRPGAVTDTGYANITVNNNGAHTHGFTTASNGSHTHTFTTGSTGGGQLIDIRNQFIVLNYIIKH
jgi:microcystin-dependent protein